ncbi:G5 domain-containing protein [Streptococcus gordonii]|uniref:G5 domain-containing protein n=5 Tax=Bacteria TaxID=2 RepID=UPI001CBACD60|nr:G5 domain-containing protein [Streptococcus gordonii]MBZ2144896.1 G5 domain-containing protein [Streptococcus gordonii]MBZ2146718.1 G5 domain-containing protein [Streptococcus gordonii]
MDRKKLIKLGISVLAVNALGAVAVYKYPELTHVPTVYAEEQPGEDEEIPDASEAQAAANFKNQMNDFEEAIKEFNPDDSDTREGLEAALEELEASHTTAVNAIKSEEGKKGFAKYEARYQALKAKAQALLNGESPKPQPDPQPQPNPDPQPQPKITTQDLTVKEPIPYGSSTEQNSALPKGTRNTKVQGVNGEKEVVYTITLTDGKETGRVKKSERVIKPAVDEVIEEGTGAVITTKEETKTEEVDFQVKEVPNQALPEGVRNVTTPGKKGVRTIVETVTYADGVETGRVVKSNTITTPAVDEVVEVGTKKAPVITTKEETKTEEVDFQVKEVPNPALPEGVRNVTTPGKKGVRTIVETVTYADGVETGRVVKSNTITTPAVDEVVEVGTKKAPVITTKEETKTEEVDFQVKEVPNPALPEGVRNVTTPGKKGVRTIVETVTYADGVETGRVVKSNEITTPAVDEVVEVGTKKAPVITTKEETKTEEVDFQVKEVPNPALPEGVRNVTTPGKKGVRTIVETVTYTDGTETGRVVKSNEITTPAVDEVVEVGTKKGVVTTTEEVVEKEVIKHGSSTVQNPALPKGTRNVKVQGVDGEKEVTYTVTKADGQEVSKVKKSETVTKPAVDEVIEEGTGPVITTKEETKTEEVDFQVKEVQNPALPEGARNVTTPGKKGVRTIVYTVTYADGVETGRVEKSNTITTPAVDEVVEVGTKKATAPVVTTENVTETQVIYHGTITLSNPDLPKGTKRIKIAGVDGEKTVVYTITKTNGVETSRVVRDEQITKTPITQVVEIGTKESGSSQSNASQDQKDPSDKAQDSKGQGQKDSTGKVQDPKDQAKPGSDAATSGQAGQTDRPQQPQYSRVNRNAEEKKNLPNTGEHANGLAALLGLVLASVTAFFNFRRKKH